MRVRLSFLAIGLAVLGICYEIPTAGASPVRKSVAPIVLSGKGIESIRIGTAQAAATARLETIFGKPKHIDHYVGTEAKGCGIELSLSWSNMAAVFDDGMFVGYNTGYSIRPISKFVTNKGLQIGASIRQAEKAYGDQLMISSAQGGSWRAGSIYGYLVSPPLVGSRDKIAGIAAGRVGCSAMTP